MDRHLAGKTVYVLYLLQTHFRNVFEHIVILCRTIKYNKSYKERDWIHTDPEVYLADAGERLNDYTRAFYSIFAGEPTFYIIDDCSVTKALIKKKDMLSELAFSDATHCKAYGF